MSSSSPTPHPVPSLRRPALSLKRLLLVAVCSSLSGVWAADAPICPISGKPANPNITVTYEGQNYAFASEECRFQFNAARENSLYQKLGGKPAIDAAVELFYKKVLADDRLKAFFDDVNMDKQRRKQKEFLSAAFGGPMPYKGKDLRKAHAHIHGLNESHFNAVAENLQKTLEELKVPQTLIDQAMAIAASTKNQVLNRPDGAK
jgi:hemoglobin